MRNSQKGFTLIELLVVIAIIGILATIVLTSLGSATKKAGDAKVSGQLSSMRAQAQLYTGSVPSTAVSGSCTTTVSDLFGQPSDANNNLSALLGGLTLTGTGVSECDEDNVALPSAGGKWAVAVQLYAGGYACVDYAGHSIASTQTTAAAATGGGTYTCTP